MVLRKAYDARQRLNALLKELYPMYSNAVALYGLEVLNEGAKTIAEQVEVIAGTRNVMGVVAPMLEISKVPRSTPALPLEVSEIQAKRKEIIEAIIAVAEYEKELIRIGQEVLRLRRIVSMLEKVLIPRLINTIRYLTMKFDEMEREEKVRKMKVKELLIRREQV